jgi:hypothetical protein
LCSSQATIGQSKNNSKYKDCSLKNEYAADFVWQKLLGIQNLIKTYEQGGYEVRYLQTFPVLSQQFENRITKLCSF